MEKCLPVIPVSNLLSQSKHRHLGLGLILFPLPYLRLPIRSIVTNNVSCFTPAPLTPPPYHPELIQLATISGIFSAAIGAAYLVNIFYGYEEWIYTSVPVRLAVSTSAAMVWMIKPERVGPMMVEVMVYDGLAAVLTGWSLGSWTGSKKGIEERSQKVH